MTVSRNNNKKTVRKKPTSRTKTKTEQKPLEVVVVPKTPGTILDKAVDMVKWVDSPFKLITVILLGIIGLIGYITYQNQDKIVTSLTSHSDKMAVMLEDEKLSSLTRELLRDLGAETVIVHQVDLAQNARFTRIAQSLDGRFQPLEGKKGAFFSGSPDRNKAAVAILNGEIICEPFKPSSDAGDWLVSRGVTYACRGSIPPEAGHMIGYIAVGFKKEPRDVIAIKARINQTSRAMTR